LRWSACLPKYGLNESNGWAKKSDPVPPVGSKEWKEAALLFRIAQVVKRLDGARFSPLFFRSPQRNANAKRPAQT